jgi:alkaline phosphatase D
MCLLLYGAAFGVLGDADESYPDPVQRIAFGSCNSLKNIKKGEASLLDAIARTRPDVFMWTGDSIYSSGKHDVGDLVEKFNSLKTYPPYARLRAQTRILGVTDDHDFGVNDVGKEMENKVERLGAYLDFLNVSTDSHRRRRSGYYHSVTLGTSPHQVKVIFLDTRWHRDSHRIPSAGGSGWPLSSLVASFSRLLCAALGVGVNYAATILGEQQWEWLEEELRGSTSDVHLLVSSIQVLTTNPLVESWGHFPLEKRRLLALLNDVAVPRFLLISGDVHHAEFAAGDDNRVYEATSSGLTHTCMSPWYGFVCPWMLSAFTEHRHNSVSLHKPSVYTGRNFGLVDIDWGGQINLNADGEKMAGISLQAGTLTVKVLDEHGEVVLKEVVEGTSRLFTRPPPLIDATIWWRFLSVLALVMFMIVAVVALVVRRACFIRNKIKEI